MIGTRGVAFLFLVRLATRERSIAAKLRPMQTLRRKAGPSGELGNPDALSDTSWLGASCCGNGRRVNSGQVSRGLLVQLLDYLASFWQAN